MGLNVVDPSFAGPANSDCPPPRLIDPDAVPTGFDEPFVRRLLQENAALRRRLDDLNPYRELAYRDALTGLWNRRYVDERLREECGRVQRRAADGFAIALIVVNGLAGINDRFGRSAGDRVVAGVSGCLSQSVRAYDACCRWGGDEFLVILPEAGRVAAASVIERVRATLSAMHAGHGETLTVSVGFAFCPADGLAAEELLEKATAEIESPSAQT